MDQGAGFSVTAREVDGRQVVLVNGELDLHTAPGLREVLLPASEMPGSRVVVDLSGVPFIDSSGLTVFVVALKRAREQGGDLRLVATAPRVLRVFSLTGLDDVIEIHPDLAGALAG